jgi:hypothetical protein
MNNLFIYGCSHSVGHNIPNEKFWGYLLSQRLNLNLVGTLCSGKGLGHIISSLFRDIYNKSIKEGDVVIWNTSYPSRFTSPKINSDIYHFIHGQDSLQREEYKIVDNGKKKRLWASDMDMVNYWFQETVVGYDILKSMGIETYQWTLLGIEELSGLLKMAHKWRPSEMELDRPISSWENLIPSPSGYQDWSWFIESNEYMIGEFQGGIDAHMNVKGHEVFYNHFYNRIKEIRDNGRNKT